MTSELCHICRIPLDYIGSPYCSAAHGSIPPPPKTDTAIDTRPPATATDLARLDGIVRPLEAFYLSVAEFLNDWKKGDFELGRLAALDAQDCYNKMPGAWQALTALSALQAEVREVTGPIAEAVGSIGMDKRGNDYVVLPYKTRDGEYHEYKSLRLEHLRHAAALHEKMEG